MLKRVTIYMGGNFSVIKKRLSEEINLNWRSNGNMEPSK